ncbi:MAG TPA: DUF6620 family protein [Niabella sp.]
MFKKLLNNLLNTDDAQNKVTEELKTGSAGETKKTDPVAKYDPVTQHGAHYSKTDFDAAAEKKYQQVLSNQDHPLSEQEQQNLRGEVIKSLYLQWNGNDLDQLSKFQSANSLDLFGFATQGYGHQVQEQDNPLYAPIHGISLYDYAAIAHALTQGIAEADILKTWGIEKAVWEEVNILWPERMKEDATFGVVTKYGEYFATAGQHPKLANLKPVAASAEAPNDNLQKLKTDRYFYEELCGARTAAYTYGLDGAQWILENFGINLADFQSVAMDWMTEQNRNPDHLQLQHYMEYQQQKQKVYEEKFAAEQGGNVADDIEF